MSMTKIAGSGSVTKCHGSATLPLTLPAALDAGGRGAEGSPATEEEPGAGGQACHLYRFIIFMYSYYSVILGIKNTM
jgi:hypothetical protein